MANKTFIAIATTLAIPAIASADVINGSFESHDFSGWTLTKDSTASSFATAALVGTQTIAVGQSLFDYIDGVGVANYSMGLPLATQPTDGNWQALLLQNGPASTRMSQIVTLGSDPQLTFDLAYHNWYGTMSADQTFRVLIRDSASDQLLATVFETTNETMTMTHQSIDLGAFSNMAVRIEFELVAHYTFFDVQLDNIHVTALETCSTCGVVDTHSPAREQATATSDDAGGCSTSRGGGSLLLAGLALVGLRRRRR